MEQASLLESFFFFKVGSGGHKWGIIYVQPCWRNHEDFWNFQRAASPQPGLNFLLTMIPELSAFFTCKGAPIPHLHSNSTNPSNSKTLSVLHRGPEWELHSQPFTSITLLLFVFLGTQFRFLPKSVSLIAQINVCFCFWWILS